MLLYRRYASLIFPKILLLITIDNVFRESIIFAEFDLRYVG